MRIAIYTNAYKPIVSGVVTAIALFRRGLLELGHEVVLFAPDYYGYRDQEEGVHRFPSVDLSRQVRFPVAVPWCPRLARTVRDFKPDVVHAHHPFVLGPVAMRIARQLGVPLIYTFHTQYEQYAHYVPFPQDMVKALTRRRIRGFANRADVLTTPAGTVRDLLRSYGVTREIILLPNPIDLSGFADPEGETIRRQLGLAPEEKVLISIGRLGVEKNLGFMLQAIALAIAWAPELRLRLVLVGAGPDETRLRELGGQLGLGDRLLFAGSVPYPAIPSYLAVADLFLMTSVSEVKPLVLLEAMAAGLPIVAVKASGAVDTITHGQEGLLTDLDQEHFAAAVVDILRDDARRAEMGRRARESVGRYSLDRVAGQLVAVYQEALEKQART